MIKIITYKEGTIVLVKKRLQTNIRMVLGAVLALGVLIGPQLFTQTANAESQNVLKVSPVRRDVTVAPGSTEVVKAHVTNLTKDPITVRPVANDFVAGDESGTPALILEADRYAPTHSLKRFMQPLKDVTIPAGKTTTIDIVITVPKTAQAGGYFGAVRFAPTDPAGGGQVNMSASVASLILLTVPGDMVESLIMTNFSIRQDDRQGRNFQTGDNITTSVRFENKGNIQVAPFGKISVTKGNDIVYDVDFNASNPREMVLPDSARRWSVPLKQVDSFGHYTVKATFTYGATNQTIETSESFWVIPKTVIIIAIASIVILLVLIVGIWLFLRSYRNRILKGGYGRKRGVRKY